MSTRRQKLALESCRSSVKATSHSEKTEEARTNQTNIYSKKYLTKAPSTSNQAPKEPNSVSPATRKSTRSSLPVKKVGEQKQ